MFDTTLLILLGLAALSFVSHNTYRSRLYPGTDYCSCHSA